MSGSRAWLPSSSCTRWCVDRIPAMWRKKALLPEPQQWGLERCVFQLLSFLPFNFLCLYRDRFNLLWVGWWILQCDCSLSHAYGLSFSKKLPWFVCILWSKCQLVILFSQRQVNNIKNYSATSTLLFHCQVALPVNSSCINSVWCFVANKVIIYLLS